MSDRARIACLPAPGRLVAVSLVLSCVTSPARAQVEVDSRTAAKVFSTEGRELAAAGNYEQACPKFERSVNLEPGVGTRFELADCWEHLGRTASAFKLFRDVADVAKEAGDESLERDARARVTALEPKLSRVVVTVEHPAPGIEVRRGSSALPEKFWGTPLPVDPGHTEVSAAAPG
ncbi:MAG TPA: hypothetical protein VF103_12605, partial [Polyangiaceae bacterium]